MNRRLGLGLLLAVTAGALALRLPSLDRRPMHNDEGINAYKLNDLWAHGRYAYDPKEFHGPTLYYAALPFVWLSEARDFDHLGETTLRLVTVAFGAGLILLFALLADGLGWPATLCAAVLTALSPAMVFYSRYFIHEMLLVFFTALVLAAGWRHTQTRRLGWALLAGAGLGLMYATKETFVFSVAALLGALALTGAWTGLARSKVSSRGRRREEANRPGVEGERFLTSPAAAEGRNSGSDSTGWRSALPLLPPPKVWLASVAVALVVSLVLFTSCFQNWHGPLDSLRTYSTWLHRAGGASPHIHPWPFYLERLIWYHPARSPVWSEALIVVLAAGGGGAALAGRGLGGASVSLARFLTFYTLILTAGYSAISYKTPWCLLNFLLGMILLAGVGVVVLVRWVRRRRAQVAVGAVLLAAAAQLGWQAYRASYRFAADRRNPYVYAQTVPNLLELVDRVRGIAQVDPAGYDLVVKVISPESFWPLPWYLRPFKRVGWWDRLPPDPYAPVVIASASLHAALDDKSNKKWLQAGIFELRPGVFLELYVEFGLWQRYVATLPRDRAD